MIKQLIFAVFILIFFPFIAFGQKKQYVPPSDSAMFTCYITNDCYLLNEPDYYTRNNNVILKKFDIVSAYSIVNEKGFYGTGTKYVAIYRLFDSGYVDIDNIEFFEGNEFKEYLLEHSNSERIKRTARIVGLIEAKRLLEIEEKKLNSLKKMGFVIAAKEYAYSDIGSQLFGLSLKFYNYTKKDIKYIRLTFRPYNRVCDITRDDIGRTSVTTRVIGPLRGGDESSVTFDELFWDKNDIIRHIIITKIELTFMNGTTQIITDVKKHLAPDVYNSCK
jgi:hypothetical protein